ncbi:MAG: hypothetical protein GKR96_05195 [Gammaproteobacteria bacterium]|nr:hypothetical protein [Gammaproteobacteria bacterium]
MNDLCFSPSHQLLEMQLHKKISSEELLQVFRRQIERYNPILNAVIATDFNAALLCAKQADDYLQKNGKLMGSLHGLPTAVKDIFATNGLKTTHGDPTQRNHVPTHDDIVVARERTAGAVIMGKTNTPYYASGGITCNDVYGLTRNPWNTKKTTSGSGGGGVSALASGMVAYADGSDVAGSLRSPAAWTNNVGFRPSSGRLPGYSGTIADGGTSTAGVLARCVKDAALFLQACDGPYAGSLVPYPKEIGTFKSGSGTIFQDTPASSIKNVKAAWIPVFAAQTLDDEIATIFADQKKVFESIVELEEINPNFINAYRACYPNYNVIEQVKALPKRVIAESERESDNSIKASVRSMIDRGRKMNALQVMETLNQRKALWIQVQRFFDSHQVIISPTHPSLAFDAEDAAAEKSFDWADHYFAPMFGLPSISIPMGFTSDGMPCGLMITGRPGDDQWVLNVAHAYEQKTLFYEQRPDDDFFTNH